VVDSIFLVKNGDRKKELRIDFDKIFVRFVSGVRDWFLFYFFYFLNQRKKKLTNTKYRPNGNHGLSFTYYQNIQKKKKKTDTNYKTTRLLL